MKRVLAVLLAAGALAAASGCGGEDQGQTPPISAAPQPAPTTSPSPTPTASGGPAIAGVSPEGVLGATFVCAGIPQVTRTENRISAVGTLGPPPGSAGYQSLFYQAANTFQFDNSGFGGSTFQPADKRAAISPTHELYVRVYAGPSPSELQLWTTAGSAKLEFGTVGLLAEDHDGGSLCFFAAGKHLTDLPTSNGFDYFGQADGLWQIGGATRRLQGSALQLNVDFASRTGTVTLRPIGQADPFADLTGPSSELRTLAGTIMLSGGTFSGSLSGADGLTGSVRGQFFNKLAQGVGLVFEIRDPAGNRAIGAAAADIRGI